MQRKKLTEERRGLVGNALPASPCFSSAGEIVRSHKIAIRS